MSSNISQKWQTSLGLEKSSFVLFNNASESLKSLSERYNCLSTCSFSTASSILGAKDTEKVFQREGKAWDMSEIHQLFNLYDYYGPQWKIISEKMPDRTPNNIKNRFYTVLRNLMKTLFRKRAEKCPKLPGQIASKDLSRLYDGKQDYRSFQGFAKMLLKKIDYNLESQKLQHIAKKYQEQIIKIYHLLYGERVLFYSSEKSCTSEGGNKTRQETGNSQDQICKQSPTALNRGSECEQKQFNPMLYCGQNYYVIFYSSLGGFNASQY